MLGRDPPAHAARDAAIRIGPEVKRSYHNEGDEDVELFILSTRVDDLRSETEMDPKFWEAGGGA